MYLLDELNGWDQVKTEVDEIPLDALTLVFLLFQDEHVVVEELLEFLIGQVDAQLLKGVELEEQIPNTFLDHHHAPYFLKLFYIKHIQVKILGNWSNIVLRPYASHGAKRSSDDEAILYMHCIIEVSNYCYQLLHCMTLLLLVVQILLVLYHYHYYYHWQFSIL